MSSRKDFLGFATSIAALVAAPQSPAPTPSPKPASEASDAARALALRMRAFDPALTDAEVRTIAEGIDPNLKLGSKINPKGRVLKNSDEPATTFEAAS